MKVLLVTMAALGVIALFTAASLTSRVGGMDYSPPDPTPSVVVPEEPGGGSPRDPDYRPAAAQTGTSTFHGPSGPPRIIGPSTPPPGQ